MKEIIDLEKLYDILTNKLTWLTEYGEEVYLLARENIRNSIQEAKKTFDADKALIQLEILHRPAFRIWMISRFTGKMIR